MRTPPSSFREALEHFERAGHLQRIHREVDPRFEIAAVLSRLERSAVVWLERVRGYPLPVVGNLLCIRERIADGLGVAADQLLPTLASAITEGIPPVVAPSGPCQDIVVSRPDLPALLPVPTFFERETGPYITAGVIAARHPVTGRRNVSIARGKLLGGNRVMLGIAPTHHLAGLIRESRALGRPLDVAVAIGNCPAVLMASNYYVDQGHDEYEIAGHLLGAPLDIVPATTVGVEAPAACEIVLEGTVGDEWVDEGLVSEFHGMYVNYGKGVVLTVSALTRRHDAIFHTILPGYHAEHMLIGGEAIGATTWHNVKRAVPAVRDVHIPFSGGGRLQAVISLEDAAPGEAQKAIFAAWAHCNLIKHIVVVDADVNVRDPEQVGYAIATRMRGAQDLVIVPGARADRAEPLEANGTVTKIGVVAQRAPHGSRTEFLPAVVPPSVAETVRANWAAYTDPPRAHDSADRTPPRPRRG
jgi:2,5-furandicarboxylate decarboxylase 1